MKAEKIVQVIQYVRRGKLKSGLRKAHVEVRGEAASSGTSESEDGSTTSEQNLVESIFERREQELKKDNHRFKEFLYTLSTYEFAQVIRFIEKGGENIMIQLTAFPWKVLAETLEELCSGKSINHDELDENIIIFFKDMASKKISDEEVKTVFSDLIRKGFKVLDAGEAAVDLYAQASM